MASPNLFTITTVTSKVAAAPQLASGDTAIYTVAANKAAKLNALVLCNTSGAAVSVSAGIIPSGGTVDGAHKVLSGYSLAAGETITVDELAGQVLGDDDKVNVNKVNVDAGTGAAVDATMTALDFA